MTPPYVNILGVMVSPFPFARVLEIVDGWIKGDARQYICCAPVSGIMAAHGDPRVERAINGAGLVVPDGMPIVWIVRRAGYPEQDRVYGPDLMFALCALGQEKGYSHFFYGGAPGVVDQLASNLRNRFPALKLAGTYSPPFHPLTPKEDEAIVNIINQAAPDILWVGISTPKQDLWMAEHVGRLKAKVTIGVGAAFDFHSGRVKQAPAWMRDHGLEWLFRLFQEPRRLWRRYLIGNPAFVFLVTLQLLGLRKYE